MGKADIRLRLNDNPSRTLLLRLCGLAAWFLVGPALLLANSCEEETEPPEIDDDDSYNPIDDWEMVTAGDFHSCGLSKGGHIACWGCEESYYDFWHSSIWWDACTPPAGVFITIDSGPLDVCAIREDNMPLCWGENYGFGISDPPEEELVDVSVGETHACGIRPDGSVLCWGCPFYGVEHRAECEPPDALFVDIESGSHHICGFTVEGNVACWGDCSHHQCDPPNLEILDISSGGSNNCGIRGYDDGMTCWGGGDLSSNSLQEFTSLDTGTHHVCGITNTEEISCWGWNDSGQCDGPTGSFVAVGSGYAHTCAIRTDGVAVCWGENLEGQCDVPEW